MNNAYHRGEIEERDLSEILVEEPFSNLLPRDERLIEELADDISRNGLNKEEPLVLMKKRSDGKLVLVDGLIRYIAAQRAGRTKGPTIIIDFRIEENAIAYALRRQCKRRQNSVPVIVYRLLMSELVSRGGGQALGGKLTQEELAESSGIACFRRRGRLLMVPSCRDANCTRRLYSTALCWLRKGFSLELRYFSLNGDVGIDCQ